MRNTVRVLLLVAAGAIGGQATAQTSSGDYGSAITFVKRNCPATATVACDGRGAGQGIAQRQAFGGEGQQATGSFAVTGTGAGSAAYGSASFDGFGLPTIKSSVGAVGNVRLSGFVASYQTYTYTGDDDLEALLLNASFHIVNSSTDGDDGTRAGGAIAAAGFAIWNKDDFFSYRDAAYTGTGTFADPLSMTNQTYLFGYAPCEAYDDNPDLPRGPRASNYAVKTLTGGETTIDVQQQNCNGEQTLTLSKGDEFVIAGFTQLIANRNGFIDATGTFRVGLDPTMSAGDTQAFRQNTSFASPAATSPVPEPATWAMMIAGFGAVGGTLRRRRTAVAVA